jgi:hypothetical protein
LLASVGLFDGPPAQGAALKPARADGARVTWQLEPPYLQGLWLQCVYADGALTLSRQLDAASTTCTASYAKPRPGQPREIALACR